MGKIISLLLQQILFTKFIVLRRIQAMYAANFVTVFGLIQKCQLLEYIFK